MLCIPNWQPVLILTRISYGVGQGGKCGGNVYIKEWKDIHVAKEWIIIVKDENLPEYLHFFHHKREHAFTFKINIR